MKYKEFTTYLDAALFLGEIQDSGRSAYMLPSGIGAYQVRYW